MATSIRLKQMCDDFGISPYGIRYALEQYQIVISRLTYGRLSKLTYSAETVCSEAQACFEEDYKSWNEQSEKAQDPEVMTLEKALGAEINVEQCWLEVRGIEKVYLADATICPEHLERADIQRWGASDCQLPLDLYGEIWRMWTGKPTDEQRRTTPWEGQMTTTV